MYLAIFSILVKYNVVFDLWINEKLVFHIVCKCQGAGIVLIIFILWVCGLLDFFVMSSYLV